MKQTKNMNNIFWLELSSENEYLFCPPDIFKVFDWPSGIVSYTDLSLSRLMTKDKMLIGFIYIVILIIVEQINENYYLYSMQ